MVPGVVLLDRAIHQAGVDLGRSMSGVRVTAAKFFSPVVPGETVTFVWHDKAAALQCELRCADRPVATLTLQLPAATGT
jgi:3-hydroxymyristoyl/3-hydroxydecanoyl-(acyl carrier protein) dehydratase